MPKTKKELVIRSGSERGDRRRTLIDDRSGIVVDVNQAGNDERPAIIIEVYPYYGSGYTVQVDLETRRHHPEIFLTRVEDKGE